MRVLIFLAMLTQSCGTELDWTGGSQECHKNYRVFIGANTLKQQTRLENLTHEFNKEIGFQILNLVSDPLLANSFIFLEPELRASRGAVGLGAAVRRISVEPLLFRKTVTYSLDILLDEPFFDFNSTSRVRSHQQDTLKTLFNHEIGHGLGLGHSDDPKDVMFPVVGTGKDFDSFYRKALLAFHSSDCLN